MNWEPPCLSAGPGRSSASLAAPCSASPLQALLRKGIYERNRILCAFKPPSYIYTNTLKLTLVPCVFCLFKATVTPGTSTKVLPHTLISPPTREVRPRRWTRDPPRTAATPPRRSISIRTHTCEHRPPPQRRYTQRKIAALSLRQPYIPPTSFLLMFRILNLYSFFCNAMNCFIVYSVFPLLSFLLNHFF